MMLGDIVVFIYLALALSAGVYHLIKHTRNHSGWLLITVDTALTAVVVPVLFIFGALVMTDLQVFG
ncbi:hypothetical protein ACFP5Y_13115 [Lactiplantibacillus daowaiensis]|uniref:Integral membrane protein n=2 Tax=Lactiplantibacillus daowaiensis TaxID=2559918 RepID=A0ABW1S399_9LACO|nr:hypothetical protein [Lactiplantibacillus daowaiensis]